MQTLKCQINVRQGSRGIINILQAHIYQSISLFTLFKKMKPNSANSFRLQRITRANSAKRHSHSFYNPDDTFKLAAINSVSRGVKFNDTSYLMGENLNKLRKEPQEEKDQMYEISHQGLTDTRKKYDDMKKQRIKIDDQIYRLKEEIKKYSIFEKEYLDKIKAGRQKVETCTQALEDKKALLEATAYEKKVLESMRHRLKADKVVYDQRKFNLEKEHSFQNKQLTIFRKDGMEISEMGGRTNKVYQAFVKELKEEQNQREEHLCNLQSMIQANANIQQFNQEREREIQEIAERAMQDKDPNEKEWYNIFITHQFVNKMLRDKIDREMMKFSTVEFAFKTIKTATGISDSQTLVFKYLNKEAVYGDLLGRITANEKRIAELKEEQEELKRIQRHQEMEKDTIQNVKQKTTDISKQMNQMEIIDATVAQMQKNKSALSIWLPKQLKKFSVMDPAHASEYVWDKSQPLQQNFVRFLLQLSSLIDECDKDFEDKTDAGDLTARDSARVARILPKRSRKNSIGEQIFDLEEEELALGMEEEEAEMVSMQREELFRNNERFMREARKRMEERRKLMVEKDKGKEVVKKVEVKKEED